MGNTAAKAGQAFTDALSQAYPAATNATLNAFIPARPVIQAAMPTIQDFLSGATGGLVPRTPSSSVTMPLPPLTPFKAPAPAAAAVAAAPTAAKAAAVDPTAGLSGLSFRQLLTLAQAGQAEARGVPKPVSAVDQAGNQLASIYQGQFSKSLSDAGNDAGKKQAAIDAFEKKMLPIALKGNTADAAIFDGSTPGAQ